MQTTELDIKALAVQVAASLGGNSVQWEFRSMPVAVAVKVLEFWQELQKATSRNRRES